jgi:raffinose/stachyose/melibiose transport system substrate-binding protein
MTLAGKARSRIAAIVSVLLIAAACGSAPTPREIVLTVWDELAQDSGITEITELNATFERAHPGVRVNRVHKDLTELKNTLPAAAAGQSPPDVVQVNQGLPDMGELVRAGLLLPLAPYAGRYGWRQRFPRPLLDLNSVTNDGSRFGSGTLYGLSQSGELIGYYYNRDKLRRLDLSPPKTWSEMQAMLGELKRRGELPIQFGDSDRDPAIHLFSTVLAQVTGKGYPRELVYDHRAAAWDRPEALAAARVVQDWVRLGYLPADLDRRSSEQAWRDFARGSGVFLPQGTWLLGDLPKVMGEAAGFLVPPTEGAGVAVGGESLAFAVTARSAQHDLAVAYVDAVTGPDADAVLARTGNLPAVLPPGPGPAAGTLRADVYQAWRSTSGDDNLVPYLDYATPTCYSTLTRTLPDLFALRSTPESFVAALRADFRAHGG